MSQISSGKVLRETRERKGYDLATVARRLRIRPDILRAIEAGDFSSMPPRGYTRNMVNAYARLLGLNPTEIVNMYLDEAYAVQIKNARGKAPSSGFNMERDTFTGRSRTRSQRDVSQENSSQTVAMRGRIGARTLYDDRTPFSRDDYGAGRERMERPGKSDRDFLSHHSGYSASPYSPLGNNGGRRGTSVHVGQTPMEYKASRLPGFMQSRLAIGIVIAIIVVIIGVVFFLFFGRGNSTTDSDVSQLPVSGINDTTGTADDDKETGLVEVAPTAARVVITVNQGNECYLETYADNVTTPYMLTGPAQENIDVTGTLTIATWTPEYATITVNSEPVTLTENDKYGGMYAYTVDFPALLEQWKKTHTSKEAQRSAAVASVNNISAQPAESAQAEQPNEQTDEGQEEDEETYEDEEYTEEENTEDNGNNGGEEQ